MASTGIMEAPQILMKLIQSPSAQLWATQHYGWMAPRFDDVCNWEGIGCDPIDGSITRIHLEDLNWQNVEMPTELGMLTNLMDLTLQNVGLVGEIPTEVASLPQLLIVNLRGNHLHGTLPAFASAELDVFDVGENILHGSVALPATRSDGTYSFRRFSVNNNKFSGKVPDDLFYNAPNLESLEMKFNALTGGLPSSLMQAPNLRALVLNNNRMMGTIPGYFENQQLERIYLESNSFSGTTPSELALLPSLKDLFLEDNKLSGTVPHELCRLMLNAFFFDPNTPRDGCASIACPVGTAARPGVGQCEPCTYVHQNPYLGEQECNHYTAKQILDDFYVQTNGDRWTGNRTGWMVPSVSECDYDGVQCNANGHIESIMLSGMNLRGPISPKLGILAFLKVLDLSDNALTGNIPSDLRFNPLEQLDLSGNRLVGFVPEMLCKSEGVNGNGDFGEFSCDYVTCPVGTFSPYGRATTSKEKLQGRFAKCIPCFGGDVVHLGEKSCDGSLLLGGVSFLHGWWEWILIIFGLVILPCAVVLKRASTKKTFLYTLRRKRKTNAAWSWLHDDRFYINEKDKEALPPNYDETVSSPLHPFRGSAYPRRNVMQGGGGAETEQGLVQEPVSQAEIPLEESPPDGNQTGQLNSSASPSDNVATESVETSADAATESDKKGDSPAASPPAPPKEETAEEKMEMAEMPQLQDAESKESETVEPPSSKTEEGMVFLDVPRME